MASVSELVARNFAEKHGEATANSQGFALRDRENADRNIAECKSIIRPAAFGQMQSAATMNWPAEALLAAYSRPIGGWGKRALDVMISLTSIILMAPIMMVVAGLIYLTMGRPILFWQQRVGFGLDSFRCFKFRTMVTNADACLRRHLEDCPEAARSWSETQKLKADPRVTPLGHILRKSSLDELPQLFNILRGDMSCIGPRPVPMRELTDRYGPAARDYIRAKPGLTGLWQVNGRSGTSYAHRIKCDRYYVRRWSFLLDLRILLRTIPAVLKFDETS